MILEPGPLWPGRAKRQAKYLRSRHEFPGWAVKMVRDAITAPPGDHGIKLKDRGGSASMEYAKEVYSATGQASFHSGGFSVKRGPEHGVEGISRRPPRRAGAGGGVLAGVPVASLGGATGSQGPCAGDHPTAHLHQPA